MRGCIDVFAFLEERPQCILYIHTLISAHIIQHNLTDSTY